MANAICSKCGGKTFVNPAALEARIKKFGTEEEMNKAWECRKCNPVVLKEKKARTPKIKPLAKPKSSKENLPEEEKVISYDEEIPERLSLE